MIYRRFEYEEHTKNMCILQGALRHLHCPGTHLNQSKPPTHPPARLIKRKNISLNKHELSENVN